MKNIIIVNDKYGIICSECKGHYEYPQVKDEKELRDEILQEGWYIIEGEPICPDCIIGHAPTYSVPRWD